MIALVLALAGQAPIGEAYALGDETLIVEEAGRRGRDLSDVVRIDAAETATLRPGVGIIPPVGGVWTSTTVVIRYLGERTAAWPVTLPQCLVTARLATLPDPTATAAALGARLGLVDPQRVPVGPWVRTWWAWRGSGGQAGRVTLRVQGGAAGNYLRISIMPAPPIG